MDNANEIMTTEEAAAWLQIDPIICRRLAEDDELPGRKVGGEWRFSKAALLNWFGDTESWQSHVELKLGSPAFQCIEGGATDPKPHPPTSKPSLRLV